MKQIRVHYVRHGETLFNVLGRMQGWCDSPLTEKGIAQARVAHDQLLGVPLVRAWCSTSERCRDTCDLVLEGRPDVPVTYTKDLREMCWGTYEGFLIKTDLDEINRRRHGENDWSDVGGEDTPTLWARIHRMYQRIFDEADDGDEVLVVSHGAILYHMMDAMLGIDHMTYLRATIDAGGFGTPNGYVCTLLCTDGAWELERMPFFTDEVLEGLRGTAKG